RAKLNEQLCSLCFNYCKRIFPVTVDEKPIFYFLSFLLSFLSFLSLSLPLWSNLPTTLSPFSFTLSLFSPAFVAASFALSKNPLSAIIKSLPFVSVLSCLQCQFTRHIQV